MTPESFRYQFRQVLKEIPKLCLLGIRGYSDQENKVDVYNDAIVRWTDGEIKIFTASVDPGKYYINHALNPHGCARLQCGLWKYQLGEHHSKKALVQASEFTVDRLDSLGKRIGEESGFFGINLHSGGPEYLVGRYSAGCQVIKSSEPWKREWLDFFAPVQAAVEIFKQTTVPYLLVDKLAAIPVEDVNSFEPIQPS